MLFPFTLLGVCVCVIGALLLAMVWRLYRMARLVQEIRSGTFVWGMGDKMPRYLSLRHRPFWIDLVPGHFYVQLLLHEDDQFFSHHGANAAEFWRNARRVLKGTSYGGGSSITQQLSKNLFTDGRRTLARKLHELLGALVLERLLSKEEILSLYLMVIRFMFPIYGIREISSFLGFSRPGGENVSQSELLISLIPGCKSQLARLSRHGASSFDYTYSYEKLIDFYRVVSNFPELLNDSPAVSPQVFGRLRQALTRERCYRKPLPETQERDIILRAASDIELLNHIVSDLIRRPLPECSVHSFLSPAHRLFCLLLGGSEQLVDRKEMKHLSHDELEQIILRLGERHNVCGLFNQHQLETWGLLKVQQKSRADACCITERNRRITEFVSRMQERLERSGFSFQMTGDCRLVEGYVGTGRVRAIRSIDFAVQPGAADEMFKELERFVGAGATPPRFRCRRGAFLIRATQWSELALRMQVISAADDREHDAPVLGAELQREQQTAYQLSGFALAEYLVSASPFWEWQSIQPLVDMVRLCESHDIEGDLIASFYAQHNDSRRRIAYALYHAHFLFGHPVSSRFLSLYESVFSRYRRSGQMLERFFS